MPSHQTVQGPPRYDRDCPDVVFLWPASLCCPSLPSVQKLWFLFHLHTDMALSGGGERPCYLFHHFSHHRPITLYGAQTQQCWRALPSYVNLIISLGASRSFTRAKLSSISDLGYYNGGFSFTLGFKRIFCNARFLPCTSISLSSVCLNWVSWTYLHS